MHARFFSSFLAHKNSMHIPTSFSQKTACYSNQEIHMQTGFFFQFSSSEKQHAYTNIILTKKLHVIRTKKSTRKLYFFSSFSAHKNNIHIVQVLQTPQYKYTQPVLKLKILEPKLNQKTCHDRVQTVMQ